MDRIVVTGGAGFVGSHLCRRLLADGAAVLAVDDLSTGSVANVADLRAHGRFRLRRRDVTRGLRVRGPVSHVVHLASPASPFDYLARPLATLEVGSVGTRNALELAHATGARFLLASTSESYGDPQVHPQPETYWGNVNPVGPRAVYDEAKRYAEAITAAYRRTLGTDTAIVRIFNTHGPRMRAHDGRVVPSFVAAALRGWPLEVSGDGSQTRSLCYVDDLVDGLVRVLRSDVAGPVNLGTPDEVSVLDLAHRVRALTGSDSEIRFAPRPADDPGVRRPDITLARTLGWSPRVRLDDGLERTIAWFRSVPGGSPGPRRRRSHTAAPVGVLPRPRSHTADTTEVPS